MFERIALAGSRPRSIRLDTRAGNRIVNEQSLPPDPQTVAIFERIRQRHGQWRLRKECCGTYNCFGHVWASRRTCIFESGEVERILEEDEYVRIDLVQAEGGDVVTYRHAGSKEIWHAGVIEMRELTGGGFVPWVLSKLNASKGEVFHPIDDVHAPFSWEREIWTDRLQQ